MGQKKRKKACKTPPSTPKDASETPKQRITTVRWPLLGAPGRAQRTPKGPPGHPWGTEGAAKTAPHKKPEPLDKKRRGQEKNTKNSPQIRSPFTKVLCSCPSGGPFWRRRGTKKTHKHAFSSCLGPRGCQHGSKPLYVTRVLNTHLSRLKFSAHLYVVIRGLGLPRLPARNRQTRPKTGLRVAVTLVWLLGPRGPRRGCPERPRSPQGNAKHDVQRGFLKIY